MDTELLYDRFLECCGVVTDSRRCAEGTMFFALKGERFDGNSFVKAALDQGCLYSVMDDPERYDSSDGRMILVPDALKALQDLAALHRRRLGIPVIGVTGTNGKTTTKELLVAVLSRSYRVGATQGNLNNQIGVPLTILGLDGTKELAVVEMGASHPHDIEELVDISQPDYGLITNVGKAHLLGFGSFEGVIRTKGELYDWIREHGGKVFMNTGNVYLAGMATGLDVMGYRNVAEECQASVSGTDIVTGRVLACDPFLELGWSVPGGVEHNVKTRLIGAYNIDNALSAIAAGVFFNVPEGEICSALEGYEPSNNRSQFIDTGRNHLIMDAYNANPTSMKAAVDNFGHMRAEHKMVILGDMRELGNASVMEHERVIGLLDSNDFETVWLVGEEFRKTAGGKYRCFGNVDELKALLSESSVEGRTILIKGSNSIKLTELREYL